MAMQADIAWFEANRPMISSSYPGMFVVVKDQAVVGAYPDYGSAYNAGTAMFGTEPFLVKEALESQPVETLTQLGLRRRFPFMGQYDQAVQKLRQDGAIVSVQIQVPAAYAEQLRAAGQAVPPPQVVRGMIDTGASISTLSDAVAAAAGLQQVGSVPIGGVGGTSTRPIFSAYFGLPEYGIALDPIEMAAISLPVGGFDVLIGRDVLKEGELTYTGARGIFLVDQEYDSATAAIPGAPPRLPSQGLSTPALIGIGAGAAALLAGTLYALGVFGKK